MRMFLFLASVIAILFGIVMLAIASSAIHEIEALILMLIGAVCLAGAGVIEAVNKVGNVIRDARSETNDSDN